jgi:hypothetical protein
MVTKLTKDAVIGSAWKDRRTFVVGHAFGPCLLVVGESCESALDEFGERYCERVLPGDAALKDYEVTPAQVKEANGNVERAQLFAAMDAGDVRVTDGGTWYWVDHYEWLREFATPREAGQFFRAS